MFSHKRQRGVLQEEEFAGVSRPVHSRNAGDASFCIQGVPVDLRTAPAGYDESTSLVVVGQGSHGNMEITMDRYDCRMLLDPIDLSRYSGDMPEDVDVIDERFMEEEKELDAVRYHDLHAHDQAEQNIGLYGAVPYAYQEVSEHGTFLIVPPPPYAPSIVKQHGANLPTGPVALKELACMNIAAEFLVRQDQVDLDSLYDIDGLEFLKSNHHHHCIFMDILERLKQDMTLMAGRTLSDASPLRILQEYDDDDDDNDHNEIRDTICDNIVREIIENVPDSIAKDVAAFIVSDQFKLKLPKTNDQIASLLDLLKHRISNTEINVAKHTGEDTVSDLYTEDIAESVDEQKRALRLKRAQQLMEKRKTEYEEKSKLIREKAVKDDRMQREEQIAAIAHHRKMFEDDSD
jgi:hypothetical protein